MSYSPFPVYRLIDASGRDLETWFRSGFTRAIEFKFLNPGHSHQLDDTLKKERKTFGRLHFPQVFQSLIRNDVTGWAWEKLIQSALIWAIEFTLLSPGLFHHFGWDFEKLKKKHPKWEFVFSKLIFFF